MKRPFIIGITGGSASGKTMFLRHLIKSFEKDQLCLISLDEYYKPLAMQPLDEKGIPNFDTPHSIDSAQLQSDLALLLAGQSVTRKEYTFNNPNAEAKAIVYDPAPLIVVEGIFTFYYEEIASLLDLKIFVDAKEDVKLKRRISRDKDERGYDIDDVLYRYEYHVAPNYEKYIEPLKHEADLIIPNNIHFQNALDVLAVFLKSKLG